MFFNGDSTARKRVDLGGRSSKERDRQVLLEEARVERKRRLELRQQTSAAIKIQVGSWHRYLGVSFFLFIDFVVEIDLICCKL